MPVFTNSKHVHVHLCCCFLPYIFSPAARAPLPVSHPPCPFLSKSCGGTPGSTTVRSSGPRTRSGENGLWPPWCLLWTISIIVPLLPIVIFILSRRCSCHFRSDEQGQEQQRSTKEGTSWRGRRETRRTRPGPSRYNVTAVSSSQASKCPSRCSS